MKAVKDLDPNQVPKYDVDARAISHPVLVLGRLDHFKDLAVCIISVFDVV